MAKFGVFHNDAPCVGSAFGRKSHEFDSFESAEKYVQGWLDFFWPGKDIIRINSPYSYNKSGDTIEIRELPVSD